jgi:recombination protein RecT
MLRIAMTSLRTTPNLAHCDRNSFLGCLLQAAQLGLEVNTPLGHAYLIPRRDKQGKYYCTLIIGYQGMIELALRSEKVTGIRAITVRAGDHFIYRDGLDPVLEWTPSEAADRENKAITHCIAIARIRNSDAIFVVLTRAQIDARMNRSETIRSSFSPWKNDTEAMIQKTGVRALFKWIPKSPEAAIVASLEDRADRGERQAFDLNTVQALDTVGYSVDMAQGEDLPVPDDVDPATGETIGPHTTDKQPS